MTTQGKTCIERVSDRSGWHSHSCGKRAIDGDYCGRHSPTRRKQRQESQCCYSIYGTMCGQPAVAVEYGFGQCALHTTEALARKGRLELVAPAMLKVLKALITPRYTGDICPWCGSFEGHGPSCPLMPAIDLIAAVEKGKTS